MFKPTGKGRYFIKIDPLTKVVRLWLYNYDIEGAHLKKDHVDVIDASVTPLLRDGGNIKLLGLASTTGNASFDATLSQHRMDGVVSHLRVAAGGRFAVSKEFAFGKQMALAFGAAKLKGGT